jgi:hypothetical protein
MIPRYARPTKSTHLYSYTNKDQDLINQGFRAGNYTFLSKFPAKIKPFGVSAALKSQANATKVHKPRALTVKRVPASFEWMPDSYNLKHQYMRKLREESTKKRRAISSKDFIPSGTPSQQKEPHQRNFLSVNSSYSSASDHASRLKWIKDTQIKYGSFRAGKSLEPNQNKSNAPDIINSIKKKVANDWASTDFDIGMNSAGFIELRFYNNTIESPEGMHNYMNMLINQNPDIGKFRLKKVQNKWGMKLGKFLVFVLAPAWAKVSPGSVFQSLNLKPGISPLNRFRRKSLWSSPTHNSTRESSMSIH